MAVKPRSIAVYRRGPAWMNGVALGEQPGLLGHAKFLAGLEETGQAVHAGPAYRLDEIPDADPIGFVSFPVAAADVPKLLEDDPGLTTRLLVCDLSDWYAAGL